MVSKWQSVGIATSDRQLDQETESLHIIAQHEAEWIESGEENLNSKICPQRIYSSSKAVAPLKPS